MAKPSITVLVRGDKQYNRDGRYILNHLWNGWEARGYPVRLAQGTREWIPGDIVIVHVDYTVIPDEYMEYARRFPVAVNGRVRDVSKNRYSSLMLDSDDEWSGRVIVKTKANYGGHKDVVSADERLEFDLSQDTHERPWRKRRTLDPHDYPVFESLRHVPPGVWRNPLLMVEKFMPEIDDEGMFTIRFWHFMGDRGFGRMLKSPYRIVKPLHHGDQSGRECHPAPIDGSAPRELRDARERLGFDYGRFDYVTVDGRTVLLDANPTPVIAQDGLDMFRVQFDSLIDGIECFA